MQRLEVSGAVRPIYGSLGVKRLTNLMHKICFTISLFHASTCVEHHVLIVRRSKFYYTDSGIITPIGGRPVHRDDHLCLYMFRAPYAHRQEVKIVLYRLWYHHAYRWPSGAQGRPSIDVMIPESV